MVDESTDISMLKQLVICGKMLIDGKPRTHFLTERLKLFPSPSNSFFEIWTSTNMQWAVLVQMALQWWLDGGVELQHGSKKQIHHLLYHLCTAFAIGWHWLQRMPFIIARSLTWKSTRRSWRPCSSSITTPVFVQQVFEKFSMSAKIPNWSLKKLNTSGITVTFALLYSVRVLKLIFIFLLTSYRWLLHAAAVEASRWSLASVLASLEWEAQEKGDPTALGLSKLMQTFNFVATLFLMSNVLPHLSRLSKLFQRHDVNLAHIEPLLSTIQVLRKMETEDSPHLQRVKEVLRTSLQPYGIKVSEVEKKNFKRNVKVKFLCSLVSHLESRFPNSEVLTALAVLDPANMPADFVFYQSIFISTKLISAGHLWWGHLWWGGGCSACHTLWCWVKWSPKWVDTLSGVDELYFQGVHLRTITGDCSQPTSPDWDISYGSLRFCRLRAHCQYRPLSVRGGFQKWKKPRHTFETGWKQQL